jgi:Uma2 family endonuclease
MAAVAQQMQSMTEAEYLEFERASDTKHEYLDGRIYEMVGASENHNLICIYTSAALISKLRGRPCKVYPSDMRVQVQPSGLYTYPDLSVVCGEAQLTDDRFDTLLNPIILVEVLSPSTEAYDRGQKFQHYRQLESLQEYLLIAQDSPRIERFLRQDNGVWVFNDAVGLESSLALTSIDCTLPLAEVYERVNFEEAAEESDDTGQG